MIAMKYKGNREIVITESDHLTYYYDGNIHTPKSENEVQLLIKSLRGEIQVYIIGSGSLQSLGGSCSVAIHPLQQLPQTMPLIPLCLRRIASTITLVDEMRNFPDQQLKLAYIVLEELVKDQDVQAFKDIETARYFVSHAICDRSRVLNLIKTELPSASNPLKMEAIFDREKRDHLSFAATYANKAHKWAKKLFEEDISKYGGYIS